MPVAKMRSLTTLLTVPAALLGVAQAIAQPARPVDAPPISIELNKLEKPDARPGAAASDCRVYVVLDNRSADSFQALQLDLIFFRTDGVIGRRLAVDMAPLPPAKKAVKLFDVAGMECPTIGQVLVNDIMACRDAAGKAVDDCLNKIALSSRAPDVSLVK
jgi:hypothetical protein